MFDRIVCLNIDKRLDEQPRLKAEFGAAGLDIQFFVAGHGPSFPAEQYDHIDVVPPPQKTRWDNIAHSYNAFLCYKKIIAVALNDNLENVALVEDDCTLLPQFREILGKAQLQLTKLPPWDMLYLCANHTWSPTLSLSENVLRLNGSFGFQFVVIRRSLFQIFLDLPIYAPIDAVAAQMLHPKYNCYAVWPNVAIPKPCFSFVEGYYYDYTYMYDNKGC